MPWGQSYPAPSSRGQIGTIDFFLGQFCSHVFKPPRARVPGNMDRRFRAVGRVCRVDRNNNQPIRVLRNNSTRKQIKQTFPFQMSTEIDRSRGFVSLKTILEKRAPNKICTVTVIHVSTFSVSCSVFIYRNRPTSLCTNIDTLRTMKCFPNRIVFRVPNIKCLLFISRHRYSWHLKNTKNAWLFSFYLGIGTFHYTFKSISKRIIKYANAKTEFEGKLKWMFFFWMESGIFLLVIRQSRPVSWTSV